MNSDPAPEAAKYRAFISYSHRDKQWGAWLHRALETYRVPKRLVGRNTERGTVRSRITPVFRDRDELPSATDLGAVINEALEQSQNLIVICSPNSAASRWVNEEILAFKRLGRADRIFCIIVDGEPHADEAADPHARECLPEALRFQLDDSGELSGLRADPVAADARPGQDGKTGAKLKLIAGMLGLGLDELRQREQQRRNRRLAIVTAVSILIAASTAILATVALIARSEADRQRVRAEEKAETANQTADFLISLFEVSNPFGVAEPEAAQGKDITALELLEKGADRINRRLIDQPAVRASLMNTMGEAFTGLGEFDRGVALLNDALALREKIERDGSPDTLRSVNSLARALYEKGEYAKAEELFDKAVTMGRNTQINTAEFGHALNGLGDVMSQFERDAEAETLFREALGLGHELHGEQHEDIARSMYGLATSLLWQGKTTEAQTLYQDSLQMRRQVLGEEHPLVYRTVNALGTLNYLSGDYEKAESYFREALPAYEAVLGAGHAEVGTIVNNLGRITLEQMNFVAAAEMLRRSLITERKLKGPMHDDLAFILNSLGMAEMGLGEYGQADILLQQALEVAESHEHWMRGPMTNLADLMCRTGRVEAGADYASRARPFIVERFEDDAWRTALLDSILGACLIAEAKLSQAEPLLIESYPVIEAQWSRDRLYPQDALHRIVTLYDLLEQPTQAERYRAMLVER